MLQGIESLTWTEFWVQVGIGLAVLASLASGFMGFLRPRAAPGPDTVNIVALNKEEMIRLTQAFESMARIMEKQEEIIESNTDQLQANTRVLKTVLDFSDAAARDIRALTIELENTRRSK